MPGVFPFPAESSLRFERFFFLFRLLAALLGIENPFADPVRLGRDFEQFIVSQVLDRFVEGHLPGRSEADLHIAA